LSQLFDEALAFMRSHLKAERLLVLFRESPDEPFTAWATRGVDPNSSHAPISMTVVDKVVESRQTLLSSDARRDPKLLESSSLLLSDVRAVLCVPLLGRDGQVRGILYADHRMATVSFTRQDAERLSEYARKLEQRLDEPASPGPPAARARSEPVRVRETSSPTRSTPSQPSADPPPGSSTGPRLSGRAMVILLRSLATLMAAGIPIGRALSVLAKQSEEKKAAEVCLLTRSIVDAGMPLSQALSRSSPSFTSFQLRLVKVGEATGQLVQVLQQLADYEESQRAMRMKLLSVLTYPLLLFGICLVMMMVGAPILLKGQLDLLAQLGTQPPMITRMVFALTDIRVILVMAAIPLLGGPFLLAYLRTPAGKLLLYRLLMRIPKIGHLIRLMGAAHFGEALAVQIRVGLGLLEALPNAAAASGNPVLEQAIPKTIEAAKDGRNLQQSLGLTEFFPRGFLLVLRAGEESGSVPETLQWLSRMYQLELEAALEMAAAALEPLLMMLMGVAAAIVALATLLPMVEVVQSL
jgi:type II secretory pathway component PulF